MSWDLDFIDEDDFKMHVKNTILKYGEKLKSYDLKKFNNNVVDPIKLIFDKSVYRYSWDEIIKNEIFRQRDKSNNNDIGYFHQNIFSYIKNCSVPRAGWDVIYIDENGIVLPDGDKVHKIYVEMKNKHNTMNSASSAKTYIKMQNQLLEDDDCACYLVEAIAKQSQNIKWKPSVDGKVVSHRRIRRVSIDEFYSIVTGDENAFFKICMKLPSVIQSVISEKDSPPSPVDTVLDELKERAKRYSSETEDVAIYMAIYLLGFGTYHGFVEMDSLKYGEKKYF